MNASCHTYECVMSHTWMAHAYSSASPPLSRTKVSNVTRMNASCHTLGWQPHIAQHPCFCHARRWLISMSVYSWMRLVCSFKLWVSLAEYSPFYRALLQSRPVILWNLLIVATHIKRMSISHEFALMNAFICVISYSIHSYVWYHTYERIHMCHTHECVMSHTWIHSDMTHSYVWYHTYECVMSHTWIPDSWLSLPVSVTHKKANLFHVRTRHVTHLDGTLIDLSLPASLTRMKESSHALSRP